MTEILDMERRLRLANERLNLAIKAGDREIQIITTTQVLEAADTAAEFRAEIPAFVSKIKEIFEHWQLAQYLEIARESEPFDPKLFEPRSHPILGEEEIEFDAEKSKRCGKTISSNALVICCWWNVRESGYWKCNSCRQNPAVSTLRSFCGG